MGECNRCHLARVQRIAPKGARVIVKPNRDERWPNSVDVFVVPADVELDVDALDHDSKHFRCWFMELTDGCEC